MGFIKNTLFILLSISLLAGCLVTRQAVQENLSKGPTPEQKERADTRARFAELEEQMRSLNGKLEFIEKGINNLTVERNATIGLQDQEKAALAERLKVYEETLTRMESQFLLLSQKLETTQQSIAKLATQSSSSASAKPDGNKTTFQTADAEFNKKNWKQAIVAFEKYRETNPKGKNYAEATYKIGLAFEELGMKSEAKVFYAEVTDKFPKSDFSKKANQRIKSIK